ncbi:hypothetical protein A6A06_01225 [Streptomyces sp. CB02923]|uniref:DUF6415 family natural product biosynthesis protein n=1 Tax=Streptomyces sp. CB02923 TaxID=1718985 RepID=UPI00093E89F2|nr:DUF6415 family natural product biosynthesis protein [Streptomyces sp. CB02923]OKI09363.1 hypothetical protein A6A06_01225 [Streptomyces sp. CB02923]
MNEVAAPPAQQIPAEEADALPVDVVCIEATCARAFRPRRLSAGPGLAEPARALRGHLALLLPADPDSLPPLARGAARDAAELLALPESTDALTARSRTRALAQLCLILLEPHRPPADPATDTDRCSHLDQGGS